MKLKTRGVIELGSNTTQTVALNTVSSTVSRTYEIQLNSGKQVVNVPWSNTTFTTSDLDGTGVISGSQQVTFSGISGKPSGLVSQSKQILDGTGIVSGSVLRDLNGTGVISGSVLRTLNGTGVFSQSKQVDFNSITNKPTIPTVNDETLTVQGTGVLGGSGTFTAND